MIMVAVVVVTTTTTTTTTTEVVGSIASEEGLLATIADARKRFAKRPNDHNSFIPTRAQVFGIGLAGLVGYRG
jgi:hypothetical protein